MKRRAVVVAAAVLVVLIAALAIVVSRQRLRRARFFRAAPAERRPVTTELLPVEQWSAQFRVLEASGRWTALTELMERIARAHPDLYARFQLQYLYTRALIENDEPQSALKSNVPYLTSGNPFRDLALFHQAEIDEAKNEPEAASRDRQALIFGYASSFYRDEAIDDETEFLSRLPDPKPLIDFAGRLFPSAATARRRDLEAHIVEMLVRSDPNAALQRGFSLLRGGTLDDPAERVSRALDRPELLRRLNAEQIAMIGQAMQNHRRFDRAVALLSLALSGLPQKRDELTFAIGRAYFGDEEYALAQQAYMRGANGTRDAKSKSEFLLHASRAAQLQGDDAMAERLMTSAIAVPGRFPATSAALTQRLRTRLEHRRLPEAAADLGAIRKGWPRDHALVEASLAYTIGMLGAGNPGAAIVTLNAIPRNLLDKFEPSEIDYWRARALERSNPPAAFAAYLNVLRASMPSHFAYFARQRLDSSELAPRVMQQTKLLDHQVAVLMQKAQWDLARRVQTDRILLSSSDHATQLKRLAAIYQHLPTYRAVLELSPDSFPVFPLPDKADRMSLLMAMGLFDEAADDIPKRWPLHTMRSALTQSLALNRGNASRNSIFAVEVLMHSVPSDYLPELLPETVRQLLYPRYFHEEIVEDSKSFGADPTLVTAIMREESRFNPRAKSEAAARGLLQFIITTAHDIGQQVGLLDLTAEDLYDPRVIIRLGAKYVSTLSRQFGDDHYQTAAAYNAGPNQVMLWSRLAPAKGDDFFLSSINFDETKHYVRKVMNTYKRYAEIYGNAGPQGGLRIEP